MAGGAVDKVILMLVSDEDHHDVKVASYFMNLLWRKHF